MHISVKEAAELLGKSQRTIRHLAQTGKIPASRIGSRWLICQEDLLAASTKTPKAASPVDNSVHATSNTTSSSHPATPTQTSLPTSSNNCSDDPHPNRQTTPTPSPVHSPAFVGVGAPLLQNCNHQPRFNVDFAQALRVFWQPKYPAPSVRKLDSFAIATGILAEIAALRNRYDHPTTHPSTAEAAPWITTAEQALCGTLQTLADGAHHRQLANKINRFDQAQRYACIALTQLLHYNMTCSEPNFSAACEQIEQKLLPSLQQLIQQSQDQLGLRAQLAHATDRLLNTLLKQARELAGEGFVGQQLTRLQKRRLHAF